MTDALSFQDAIARLEAFWTRNGCIAWYPHNVEVGAGTMNPATFLRVLGPEPWNIVYVEPSVRPDDARYGENPNRVGRHHQLQVILKPDPGDPQGLYLESLAALGVDLARHDVRFVEDNWESPALGAWGLGWEVWLDGLEITQFTYFQQAGSLDLDPVSVEITYGLDRIVMALQDAKHFRDLMWSPRVTAGDLLLDYEIETSRYYFEAADVDRLRQLFDLYEQESQAALSAGLITVAHDYALKCSHVFNVLDARGAVGVTDRAHTFGRMRRLSTGAAAGFVARREELGFPLVARHPNWVAGGGQAQLGSAEARHATPEDRSNPQEWPAAPADFVLEIGTEELPVADVDSAQESLALAMDQTLESLRLSHGPLHVWGTPRRLVVYVEDLAAASLDLAEHVVGPPVRAAYDSAGAPTKAAEGFARSVGVAVEDLETVERSGEERVAAVRRQAGGPAAEALATALPAVLAGVSFPRSMRWNASQATFSRPVRWLLALHGAAIVPVAFAGLVAGRASRGLRSAGSPLLEVTSAAAYRDAISAAGITLEASERRELVRIQANTLAAEAGGGVSGDAGLIAEVANLVEQPHAVLGSFDPSFLTLPGEVLVTVMKKHQRYFPVASTDGPLLAKFVAVANGATVDDAVVRHGYEAVLAARFADAAYFWRRDMERPLADYTPGLERLAFERRLGSVLDKVRRLERSVPDLAEALGLSREDRAASQRAAELSKSDLATSLVVEMTSLQGVVGRYYGLASGEPPEVADALLEQYLPRSSGDALPMTWPGRCLGLADRLDSLVGLFAVGLRPSGTQDPFGLRRAALGIGAVLVDADADLDLSDAVALVAATMPVEVSAEVRTDVLEFLTRRLEGALRDDGNRPDVVAAVLAVLGHRPAAASRAVADLGERVSRPTWTTTLTAFARCARIVRGAADAGSTFDPNLIQEDAEKQLAAALTEVERTVDRAALERVLDALDLLAPPINRFFESVMVMADDPMLRANRLALVGRVPALAADLADFSLLEGF